VDFLLRHENLTPDRAHTTYGAYRGHSSPVVVSTRYAESRSLPIGAQARLISAAAFSARIGFPLDTLLSINAAHLQRIGEGGVFRAGHLWDGFRDFLELVRKWVTGRGVPWVAIWSREYASGKHGQAGEHWHIGLHLPSHMRRDFAAQVALWTGECLGGKDAKKSTVALSVDRAWHLRARAPSGNGAEGIGAYLGKAEPSWRRHYGRTVPNACKPARHIVGGEGPIQGKRFGISRSIGDTAQSAPMLTAA
jgi:hypothetical protein